MSIISTLLRGINSPSFVLRKTAVGKALWRSFDKGDRAMQVYLNRHLDDFNKHIKFARGSPKAKAVGILLDYQEDPAFLAKLPVDVRDAYYFLRKKFVDHADELGLEPGRRFKNYLPHIFDKDLLVRDFTRELDDLTVKLGRATDSVKIANLKQKADELQDVLSRLKGNRPIDYEHLPQSIRFRFFEKRTGKKGYSFDAVEAYRSYLFGAARKIYHEPLLKDAARLIPELPEELKPYARWYVKDFMGYLDKDKSIDQISRSIRNFEFMRTIGFNPRSALVNLTQNVHTITDIGPRATLTGAKLLNTAEGRKLVDNSGHLANIEIFHTLGTSPDSPTWQRALDIGGALFNRVEKTNRGVAYLGALAKFHKTDTRGLQKLFTAGKISSEARNFADDVVRRTQFRYGKVDLSKFHRDPIGGVIGQFTTFPIKATEMLVEWAENNPKKLFAYLALSEGINFTADRALNVDLTDALGAKVSFWEAGKALAAVGQTDWKAAVEGARKALSKGAGVLPVTLGGRFGPGAEAVREGLEVGGILGDIVATGKTLATEGPRLGRIAAHTILPVPAVRAKRAVIDEYRAGGSPREIIQQFIGFPTRETVMRKEYLHQAKLGQMKRANELKSEYQKRTGKDFFVHPEALTTALKAYASRQQKLAEKRALPLEFLPEHIFRRVP